MNKVTISLVDIEHMKTQIGAIYAHSGDSLYLLFIKEYTGYLKRKGVDLDVEIEESTQYGE